MSYPGRILVRMEARIEVSVTEARARFVQLVRLTGLNRQTTVIVDQGRPLAALVSPDVSPAPSAAGWLRRIEAVRADLIRRHTARAAELSRALDEAWELLDAARPPGADRAVDALRTVHRDLRQPGGPTGLP